MRISTFRNKARTRFEYGVELWAISSVMGLPLDDAAREILLCSLGCTDEEWLNDPVVREAAIQRGRLLLLHALVVGVHQGVGAIDAQTMAAVAEVVEQVEA